MVLYLLTTKGAGDFYLVADDPNEAQDTLIKLLDKAKEGVPEDRKVVNIKVIAEEFFEYQIGKAFFSKGYNLIIVRE